MPPRCPTLGRQLLFAIGAATVRGRPSTQPSLTIFALLFAHWAASQLRRTPSPFADLPNVSNESLPAYEVPAESIPATMSRKSSIGSHSKARAISRNSTKSSLRCEPSMSDT